ncbi:hypothetical protein RhiirA4_420842 [Rhizophagus irregularis]|uniref:Uncharacterized protein n=1 Tax=Rhizophagus irregularis TaxID=588596 RepID=A0A2I1GJC9_9GLOM|nr:hypothetical protein RhiirA4_420842 [Rhizophagus irregularis]
MKIAIPVIQEQISDDNSFFDQDLEDSEYDIELSREWRNLINEWIEMVDEDEIINQTDEENNENLEPFIDCVMDLDQILRKQHPLTNKNAKWKSGSDPLSFVDLWDFFFVGTLTLGDLGNCRLTDFRRLGRTWTYR